jgi:hypothetical protein
MSERMQNTVDVIKAGEYDYQRIGSYVLGLCAGIEALAAMGPDLPPQIAPYIMAVKGWAAIVGLVVSGVLAKLGKPVLVKSE